VLRIAWRSLGAHKLRMALSLLAVVLGVAFVAGTLVFTDTLRSTFEELFGQTETDVVVSPVQEFNTENITGTIPDSVREQVAGVEGVARVGAFVQANGVTIIDGEGDPVGTLGAPNFGVSWGDDAQLSPLRLVEGRGPTNRTEVAIDSQSAESGAIAVGDQVRLVTPGPLLESTVVGIFRYGTSGNLAGATLTAFEPAYAQDLLTAPGEWTEISALADEGVSQEELAQRVRAVVPSDYQVQTGQEADDEAAAQLSEGLAFFNVFLLVFAVIALFVGTFLILNTFSMLVAQRTKELALLRALGANRRQVTASLLVEAAIVGLLGGALGLLLGVGLAVGLQGLFGAIGLEIPSSGLIIQWQTIVIGLVLGVVVTVVAALLPALRAARVPPVAAMRDDLVLPARSLRVRTIIGSALLALAVLGAIGGVASAGDSGSRASAFVGLGALLGLVGAIVLSPSLSGPVVAVLGWPWRRSTVGRLATGNARRNRRRTATTASALMIGLTLVSAIGVLGASTTASTDATVDEVLGADFIITSRTFQPFTTEVSAKAAEVPGVQTVSTVLIEPAQVNGSSAEIVGIQAASVIDGSLESVDDGDFIVDSTTAADANVGLGDTVDVLWQGGPEQYRIGGVYEAGPLFSGFVAARETLVAAGARDQDIQVLIAADPAADAAQVRAGLDAVVEQYPTVQLQDQTEFKEQIRAQINQLLFIVYALLGLAVIIAILGIVNTLALSVVERTREIGLLRAIGISRGQLRSTIRIESLLIAVYGAVLGVVLGVTFGALLQRALSGSGITELAIPWTLLIVVLVLAAVVGVIAAVWPARRAAKLDILQAIATE